MFLAQATLEENLDLVTVPVTGGVPWLWIIFGAAGLLAIAAPLIIRWWPRKKKVPVPVAVKPDPIQVAHARLEALRGRMGGIEPHAFSIEVSSILRGYLLDRFQIAAPARTSAETLAELGRHAAFPQPLVEPLSNFLAYCDHIKFARYTPGDDIKTHLLGVASQVIATPVPKPAETP